MADVRDSHPANFANNFPNDIAVPGRGGQHDRCISERVIQNQAAYINGWLKTLRGDARAVVFAAASAEGGAELILGRTVPVATTEDAPSGAA